MNINIPINVYTVGIFLTLALWIWYWQVWGVQHGDFDFGPAIIGFVILCTTIGFWTAVLLARFL